MINIPLKGNQSGTQYADWLPRIFAMEGLGNRSLVGQKIPVAGGVALNADVYTPAKSGRYPAVVCFAGYTSIPMSAPPGDVCSFWKRTSAPKTSMPAWSRERSKAAESPDQQADP